MKVLPADKDNPTLIINTLSYEKMHETLKEGKYTQLNNDSTKTLERKVEQTLRKYKSDVRHQWMTLCICIPSPRYINIILPYVLL